MEAVVVDRQGFHLLLGVGQAGGVFAGVELDGDGQPGGCGGGADQLDHGLVAGQRPAAPVAGDLREQPVLDLIPLGGARRVMAYGDLQPGLGGQPGQLHLPGPGPGGVRAAGIGADQQPPRTGVAGRPAGPPPAAQRRHCKRGGVVVGAHRDPPGVGVQVVDAVRDRLADRVGGEVVHVNPLRAALRPPLGAAVGEVADLLLLLGVDRDDRLAGVQELARLPRDVAELGVPVRVLPALGDLGVALQAVALGLQQPRRRRRRAPVPGLRQRARQGPGRQARPPQRRLRIPPRLRLHQRHQRRAQLRVGGGQLLAAAARRPRPRLRRPGCLPRAAGHRSRVSACHAGDRLHSAAAQPGRLRP